MKGGAFLTRELGKILERCFKEEVNLKTHSFRIGGASAAAVAGLPSFVIQQLGQWKSDAFRRYIQLSKDYLDEAYTALVKTFK